jgi:hypothetical protein
MDAKQFKICAVILLAALTLLSLCIAKEKACNSKMNEEDCEKKRRQIFRKYGDERSARKRINIVRTLRMRSSEPDRSMRERQVRNQ